MTPVYDRRRSVFPSSSPGQPVVWVPRSKLRSRHKEQPLVRLLRHIAYRLHGASPVAHHAIYSIDLSANRQRFDLLSIVQAIASVPQRKVSTQQS
jgi:hypothetical protein